MVKQFLSDKSKLIFIFLTASLLAMSPYVIANDSVVSKPCAQQSEIIQPCSHDTHELPKETIEKLKVEAGFGWGIFSGSIYNGSSEYAITKLIVSMTPIHDHHHMAMMGDMQEMAHEARIHQINMNLRPLAKGAISMALDEDVVHVHDFEWEILNVYGYKAH